MSTTKSKLSEHCPWKENLRSPTQYRLALARRFSREGRKIFGPRWKGIYVIGSTASSFTSPLSDVDVVPLVEKPETEQVASELEKRRRINLFIRFLESQTGVCTELWWMVVGQKVVGKDTDITYLDKIRTLNVEQAIQKSASLLDADVGLDLPERIERPLNLDYYRKKDTVDPLCGRFLINRYGKGGNFLELRGETPEASEARTEFNRAFMEESKRFLALIGQLIKEFRFGKFRSFVVAYSILENFIFLRGGLYERLEFFISKEPKTQALLGFIPDRSYMLSTLYEFSKALSSENNLHLEDKLRAFNGAMQEHLFIGGPIFLLDRK